MRYRQIVSILKDLWIHFILLIISLFLICKNSDAPIIFNILDEIFLRPQEGTLRLEISRVAENLSLAYMASFIFYLIIDYIPKRKEQAATVQLVNPYLQSIYMHMNKIGAYFKYSLNIIDINCAISDDIKRIDNFSFLNEPEFLMVSSLRNEVDSGGHIELFDGKVEIIRCGKGITEALTKIDSILIGNQVPVELIRVLNRIRCCGLMEQIIVIFPSKEIEINGVKTASTYLNLYNNLSEFLSLEKELSEYIFLKRGTNFRKASEKEINDWLEYQQETRRKYPWIEQIVKQL
ncbi:MAG: hypothetical protein AB9836_10015 [Aminipila sp.]